MNATSTPYYFVHTYVSISVYLNNNSLIEAHLTCTVHTFTFVCMVTLRLISLIEASEEIATGSIYLYQTCSCGSLQYVECAYYASSWSLLNNCTYL